MSKPNCLKRREDGSYVHKYAAQYKIYSVNHEDVPAKVRSFYKRKGWVMVSEDVFICAIKPNNNSYYYAKDLSDMVEILSAIKVKRVNVRTNEVFEETVTTPYYCSPSSETYWSM
jgi:hypothetical protein